MKVKEVVTVCAAVLGGYAAFLAIKRHRASAFNKSNEAYFSTALSSGGFEFYGQKNKYSPPQPFFNGGFGGFV